MLNLIKKQRELKKQIADKAKEIEALKAFIAAPSKAKIKNNIS